MATGTASAQVVTLISPTVQDGGFESITGKSNFPTVNTQTGAVPYWAFTQVNGAGMSVGASNDTGAETGVVGTTANNTPVHTGAAGAYFQPTGSTAFNLATTRTIQAGDLYTVTWFGRLTGTGGQQVLTLFTQSPNDVADPTAFTYAPTATVLTAAGGTNPAYTLNVDRSFTQYTATYAAQAGDVGNYIGLTIGNNGTAFIGEDDFTLTVSKVPEPSVYIFLGVGVVGLWVVRRNQRSVTA